MSALIYDITNHKWNDLTVSVAEPTCNKKYDILILRSPNDILFLHKDDSIAIAKHFYNQLSLADRPFFINAIKNTPIDIKSLGAIPQSKDSINGEL